MSGKWMFKDKETGKNWDLLYMGQIGIPPCAQFCILLADRDTGDIAHYDDRSLSDWLVFPKGYASAGNWKFKEKETGRIYDLLYMGNLASDPRFGFRLLLIDEKTREVKRYLDNSLFGWLAFQED